MNQHFRLLKNELDSDFKATAKAASLYEEGIPLNQIEILPLSGKDRAFSKEISSINNYVSEQTDLDMYRIIVNREGLYDMLPEGLFHQLSVGREILDEDMMIHDIREKRIQEQNARLFFSPFESELNQLRLRIEVYENQLDLSSHHDAKSKLFEHSWDELRMLDNRQKVIWMHFLPEIQHHKNDLKFLQRFLHLLLNIPVTIHQKTVFEKCTSDSLNQASTFQLGSGQLGVHSLLKEPSFFAKELVEVQLGPATPHLLAKYLPQSEGINVIQTVLDYLLPVDVSTVVSYEPSSHNKHSLLSPSEGALLGHTSYL